MQFESPPAVDCVGLAHRYGAKWALRGVHVHVAAGEIVALVGRNGSGKTTLMRAIATALRPTRGTIRVFGHDTRAEPGAVREVTALVGHATGVYTDLSAAENLQFAIRMTGDPASPARVQEVLERVGLAHESHARARDLSAGQLRRVALARVLLRPVQLLLLDEPYTSFDEEGVAVVDRELAAIRARGGAAIVITHDAERARRVTDRAIRLDAGSVVEAQPPLKVANG